MKPDTSCQKWAPVVAVDEDWWAVVMISGHAQMKNTQGVKEKHLTGILNIVKRKVFLQDASIHAANPLGGGFSSIVSCS